MPNAATTLAADRPESQRNDSRTSLLIQKNELVGHLAGVIAHRFNNIMMAITSYAEIELKRAAPAQKRSLEQVLTNASHAASLVQKLLTFSRPGELTPQPLSLNSIITALSGLLQQLAGETAEVVFQLDPKIQSIKADVVELEQLILGLIVTMRDAIVGGGKLVISTEPVELDKTFFESDHGTGPGKYVMLCINAESAAHSRANSREKGDSERQTLQLLAAASAIVHQAGGVMRISGSAQKGKSYAVYFPALNKAAIGETLPEAVANKVATAKTILVVEDDDAVRIPAAEFLKMEGFKVLQAKTGPEALRMVERHQGALDLLIADLMIPEMSGSEVAEKLREIHPGLKVLYMSGDSGNDPALKSSSPGHAALQKPFRLNKLSEKIYGLLGR